MFVCLNKDNRDTLVAEAWFYLNKVTGSFTADSVDLTVDDWDDLRQRQTDCRQTGHTDTQTGVMLRFQLQIPAQNLFY